MRRAPRLAARAAPLTSALTAAFAATFTAGRAEAHSFEAGADFYAQFVEGTASVLAYPSALLPLIALGILLSLWRQNGLLHAWPVFLAGQAGGILVAVFVAPWILPVTLAAGLAVAVAATLLPRPTRAVAIAAAATLGLLVLALSLEGHGLFELSVFIHAGMLLGANMTVAVTAALAQMALDRVEAPWMRILWRIAASWVAAILVLYLALTLVTPT